MATTGSSVTDEERPGLLERSGLHSPWRLLVLLAAVAFLGGAVGWAVSERGRDPLSSTDVGFMQDMGFHHAQAVELSLLLAGKDDVDGSLKNFAYEIIISQQADRGMFNATLDRFGYASDPGDTVMAWMGPGIPIDKMEGLATAAQMADLKAATGKDAEALWIALMSEHHLGGVHMADWEARHGHDRTTRNIAKAMVTVQLGEIADLQRYRSRTGLPIPEGFSDPLKDQRMHPLSTTDGG
jgi:uncharacterized protein (DUF305 family)